MKHTMQNQVQHPVLKPGVTHVLTCHETHDAKPGATHGFKTGATHVLTCHETHDAKPGEIHDA